MGRVGMTSVERCLYAWDLPTPSKTSLSCCISVRLWSSGFTRIGMTNMCLQHEETSYERHGDSERPFLSECYAIVQTAHFSTGRHAEQRCLPGSHVLNAGIRPSAHCSATAYAHQNPCVRLSQRRPPKKNKTTTILDINHAASHHCVTSFSYRQGSRLRSITLSLSSQED
jgi:hypothetical protein